MTFGKTEANLAIFHAELLQGSIQDDLGNFQLAVSHFQKALEISQSLNDFRLIARAEYDLGITLSRIEDFDHAKTAFRSAIQRLEKIGNRVQEMRVRSNFAAMLMNSGNNREGISEAKRALSFFEKTGADTWIARNANNIAEEYKTNNVISI